MFNLRVISRLDLFSGVQQGEEQGGERQEDGRPGQPAGSAAEGECGGREESAGGQHAHGHNHQPAAGQAGARRGGRDDRSGSHASVQQLIFFFATFTQ